GVRAAGHGAAGAAVLAGGRHSHGHGCGPRDHRGRPHRESAGRHRQLDPQPEGEKAMSHAPDTVPTTATDSLGPPATFAPRGKEKSVVVRLLKHPLGATAVGYLVLVALAGIFARLLAPVDPKFTDLASTNAPPFSEGHILGADASGRDILSLLLYGTTGTFLGCALVLSVSLTLGVVTGLVGGYYRGRTERILEFLADSIMTLPGIVLLIALYARTGPNMVAAMC